MPRVAVIEAPSILGLRPTGVDTLPEALLRTGLIDRLAARHAGRVAPESPYDVARDPATLTRNANWHRVVLTSARGGGWRCADRDAEEQAAYGSPPLPHALLALDLPRIRSLGIEAAARNAMEHLTRDHGPDDGFWIHVDADVLDDSIMPAVDYRLPGGLSLDELTRAPACGHRVAAGGRPRGDDL